MKENETIAGGKRPGEQIGEYAVIRLLGKGGMSEVYEVERRRLGSRHALKLFTYPEEDREVRERFENEGRMLSRLSHPRIVKVTDVGVDTASERPFFVMELVRDERGGFRSLADVEPGTVDEETIGRWYDDLREALGYIHAQGIVHRDLKLENVLLGPDGHIVLSDFGISRVSAQGEGTKVADTINTIVRMREGRNLVMGSIGYMAPELEMGVAASPQSDWYALGVIVYRLLTGSWCDARTDIVANLETYGSVWRRILPPLLHSNPRGRECRSYDAECRAAAEENERRWEERWLKAKSIGRWARRLAAAFAVMVVLVGVGMGVWVWRLYGEKAAEARKLLAAEARLALPGFSDVCRFTPEKVMGGKPTKMDINRQQATHVDAWWLTRDIFSGLRHGQLTYDQAKAELTKLADAAEADRVAFFIEHSNLGLHGDPKQLPLVLKDMVRRLEEWEINNLHKQ